MLTSPPGEFTSARVASADNPLIAACGPARTRAELGSQLLFLPERPNIAPGSSMTDTTVRGVSDVWRLHVPTRAGLDLADGIDRMLRTGYTHRNPLDPSTWRRIYGPAKTAADHYPIQLGATVFGMAGVGKTTALERTLLLYPQVITHEAFPGLVGPVRQLLWLKIDTPASGKIADLIEGLVRATDEALGTNYTAQLLKGRPRRGAVLAQEWLQRVSCHFPGLLVIDEIQNLFKVATKAAREAALRRGVSRPELRIVDDEALKFLLTLSNTAKIPTLVCGTPDGIAAFSTRMSTSQRLVTGGFYFFPHADTPDDEFFAKYLFPQLCAYQWFPKKLPPTTEFRQLIHRLSGGLLRICMTLWVHAHLVAVRRRADSLSFEDFHVAASTSLAPLQSMVRALTGEGTYAVPRFEDLIPDEALDWLRTRGGHI